MVGFFCGMLFDDQFVQFKDTKNVLYGILRVLGGMGIYLGLGALLKLPFPKEVREANDFLAHLIRAGRYAVTTFVVSGVYPMLFNVIDKKLDKRNTSKEDTKEE